MKHVFVGDIHGKTEIVRRALDMDGKIIFVGDFMDSFDRVNSDHAMCLRLVCDAIKAGKAESIYGNHELSYIMPHHRCSGYDPRRAQIMQAYEAEIRELFKPHLLLAPDLLVTHAGLTKQIWDDHFLDLDSLDVRLSEWWHDVRSPVHQVGMSRGGWAVAGGTFWCDWNMEFKPIEELRQVFGHSASGGEAGLRVDKIYGNSWNIDCLDRVEAFLEVDL